jgi:hypothetical protein
VPARNEADGYPADRQFADPQPDDAGASRLRALNTKGPPRRARRLARGSVADKIDLFRRIADPSPDEW